MPKKRPAPHPAPAFQRLYDMILSHGTTKYSDHKKDITHFKFFDDPIDGGKDAILSRRDPADVTAVREKLVFHFSLRRDYQRKLWEDLRKTFERALPLDIVVFLTSREVTPSTREKLQNDVKAEFGWTLEIYDQQWLRVPLDGEFQRLRKQYLGIDYDQHVFHDLASLLDVPERHPNREDLSHGAYYRNEGLHDRVHMLLDTRRHCLISGKPGHGKSALAKAVGWELLSRTSHNAVTRVRL